MTDADQLRQALDHLPAISGSASDRHSVPADRLLLVADAARSWLSLQEADETTVEKVADVIALWLDDNDTRNTARQVLAAIVGEET